MFTGVRTSDTEAADDGLSSTGVLDAGAMAGPWRVEHELGRGGMATVYAVTHDEIGKRAALKVAHAHVARPWFTAERFLLEARVVNQVAHAGIVDIFETGALADGRLYLVMERLDGMTLGQRLARGPMPAEEVCAILREVCAPIGAAHAAHVVHRDLKLDNVFLLDGGAALAPIVKVLDWGIAKIITSDPTNTFADHLVGTPRYLSPEQARGEPVTTRADVYSLGVMAYELFLGAPPFVAGSTAEVLGMHLRDRPPPPHERWPQIPPALEALLLEMLEKEAADRPTIDEVAWRLRAVGAELRRHGAAPIAWEGPVALLSGPTSMRRARLVRTLAVVALLGVAVAASPRAPAAESTVVPRAAPRRTPSLPPAPVPPVHVVEPVPAAFPIPVAAPPADEVAAAPPPRDPRAAAPPLVPRHRVVRHRPGPAAPAAPVHALGTVGTVRHGSPPARAPGIAAPHRIADAVDPDGTIEPYR